MARIAEPQQAMFLTNTNPSQTEARMDEYVPNDFDAAGIVFKYLLAHYVTLDVDQRETFGKMFDVLDMLSDLRRLQHDIASVRCENYIFTDYLERNEPKLLTGVHRRASSIMARMPTAYGYDGKAAHSIHLSHVSSSKRSVTGNSGNQSYGRRRGPEYMVNYRAKADMAEKCANEVEARFTAAKKIAMRNIKDLRAKLNEMYTCTKETNETIENFKLHFLDNVMDVHFLDIATEREMVQHFLKFTKSWRKTANNMLSNCRLLISTTDHQCERYRQELITKRDMKGILTTIDYERLLIWRTELLAKMREKMAHMSGIKDITSRTMMSLTEQKRHVSNMEDDMKKIERKINEIERSIERLSMDVDIVEKSNQQDRNALDNMNQQLDSYIAPTIQEYIITKNELSNLIKEERILRRKINIAKMKLENLHKGKIYNNI